MSRPRLLFASIHAYLDPSSGAALATRERLELLAGRGWDCRVSTCGILDFERATSVDALRSSTLEFSRDKAPDPLQVMPGGYVEYHPGNNVGQAFRPEVPGLFGRNS
jgi:hypothetical protein